jgi:hypothetical protein
MIVGKSRRRGRPAAAATTSIALTHSFNRRAFVLGAVQGGVGLLLATAR